MISGAPVLLPSLAVWPALPAGAEYAQMTLIARGGQPATGFVQDYATADYQRLSSGIRLYRKAGAWIGAGRGRRFMPQAEEAYTGPGDRVGGYDPSWSLQTFLLENIKIAQQNASDSASYDKLARIAQTIIAIGGVVITAGVVSGAMNPATAAAAGDSSAAGAGSIGDLGGVGTGFGGGGSGITVGGIGTSIGTGSAVVDTAIGGKITSMVKDKLTPKHTPTSPAQVAAAAPATTQKKSISKPAVGAGLLVLLALFL